MKKLLALTMVMLAFHWCSAQEPTFAPITLKDAPTEAVNYLKTQKLKAKKAKWGKAQPAIYIADFKKKKVAFYFRETGELLYKRTPIKFEDLPKGLVDAIGNRLKAPGTLAFLYKGTYTTIYAISVPTSETTYVTKFFTSNGAPYELTFK
jgi:hypothetical protein